MITAFFKKKSAPDEDSQAVDSSSKAKRVRESVATVDTDNVSRQNKKAKDETSVGLLRPVHVANEPGSTEVDELLEHLKVPSWKDALKRHLSSNSFGRLAKFVVNERKSHTVYPEACDTFAALNWCPLEDVKVVIVGQDPYHGPNQAHGLCFSVRKGVQIPPSLRNIYLELRDDPQVDFPAATYGMPKHGMLDRWAKQGVLMLNSVLTVRKGQAFSHQKKGWEEFTDEVIRVLDQQSQESGKGLVFLLWGKPASEKTQALLKRGVSNHTIIFSSHPSPLAARKTSTPFLGSKCFSRANQALEALGHQPIDWNVDGI